MMNPLEFFKLVSDETRLLVVLLIRAEGELCVCELTEALEQSQPKISRHLALLKKHELLVDRRQGQWVYYNLNPALDGWISQSITLAYENNPSTIKPSLKRLHEMGNRPERNELCC